ncbi:MAG: hypothetical protein D8M58_14650 [Calditrichaeota bacterium]|nr:MAG: hypothetical protein DWQ03_15890 [Calditrichota bacterium]MBL1206642.1 hypothetical protein [Calditrichota bacterium]NOG46469.1 hypothetical protein [Calditrichota bacterium]
MSNLKKVLIPVVLLFVIYAVYILKPTKAIGSFDKVRAGGEINQNINVLVNQSKGFDRDANGMILAFYANDIKNQEAIVSLKEPGPAEIATARVVEILGHMHGDTYIATRVTVVE